MSYDNFLIDDTVLDLAKELCKYIENNEIRNRSVANVVAASIPERYFTNYSVDKSTGLHNVPKVLEDIDIADIYILGNYVDVRLSFQGENLYIPTSHIKNGIKPLAYMFIELSTDLTSGCVLGFLTPDMICDTSEQKDYLEINASDLKPFSEINSNLQEIYNTFLPDNFDVMCYDYISDKLENKIEFIQFLLTSQDGRQRLIEISNAQNKFKYISLSKNNQNETEEYNFQSLDSENLLTDIEASNSAILSDDLTPETPIALNDTMSSYDDNLNAPYYLYAIWQNIPKYRVYYNKNNSSPVSRICY